MNPTDLLAKSSKMLEYYRDAYITINILDSEDSLAGFLHPRNDGAVSLSTSNDLCLQIPPATSDMRDYTHVHGACKSDCCQLGFSISVEINCSGNVKVTLAMRQALMLI
jgi:hypothetical protein